MDTDRSNSRYVRETSNLALYQYYNKLRDQDWYYMFSEDKKQYEEGQKKYARLYKSSRLSEEHEELWNAYQTYALWGSDESKYPEPEVKYNG